MSESSSAAGAANAPASDAAAQPAASSASASAPSTWYISSVPPRPAPALVLSDPADAVQLHYLCDMPHLTRTVAESLFGEWPDVYRDYFSIDSVDAVERQLREQYSNRDHLSMAFVATVGGAFACTVSLALDDTPTGHPYYGVRPWMICLYCAPEFRRKGIALRMIERVKDVAAHMGYRHLWLITENMQGLYGAHGFKQIESLHTWYPRYFTVMRHDIDPKRLPQGIRDGLVGHVPGALPEPKHTVAPKPSVEYVAKKE